MITTPLTDRSIHELKTALAYSFWRIIFSITSGSMRIDRPNRITAKLPASIIRRMVFSERFRSQAASATVNNFAEWKEGDNLQSASSPLFFWRAPNSGFGFLDARGSCFLTQDGSAASADVQQDKSSPAWERLAVFGLRRDTAWTRDLRMPVFCRQCE